MQIRMIQFGTKHGHAAGKALAMQTNPDVELIGLYEPDVTARARARDDRAYAGIRWYESADEALSEGDVAAVAIEGRNDESLAMAHLAITAGKHLWYDKPAGDDWPSYQRLVRQAREQSVTIQMGFMFRYHEGFRRIGEWAKSGFLGDIFSVRAHMSTWIPIVGRNGREFISQHPGGIFYDLGAHMLDQVVWLLGRPTSATGFFANHATPEYPSFMDNTFGVYEFERAMAFVDIAAMVARPLSRRFEVYGTRGTAIIEPFEPRPNLFVTLDQASAGYAAGLQSVPVADQPRQVQYERELAAFVATLRGEQAPDRSLDHDLVVQETLLRTTRGIDARG
jgi:predicted dehydrogenase